MLGACVLVQVDQKASRNDPGMSLPDSTEDMTLHLSMAIEALRHLDNDNRMVARCRDYLEQFVQVVQALGKEVFHYAKVLRRLTPMQLSANAWSLSQMTGKLRIARTKRRTHKCLKPPTMLCYKAMRWECSMAWFQAQSNHHLVWIWASFCLMVI